MTRFWKCAFGPCGGYRTKSARKTVCRNVLMYDYLFELSLSQGAKIVFMCFPHKLTQAVLTWCALIFVLAFVNLPFWMSVRTQMLKLSTTFIRTGTFRNRGVTSCKRCVKYLHMIGSKIFVNSKNRPSTSSSTGDRMNIEGEIPRLVE